MRKRPVYLSDFFSEHTVVPIKKEGKWIIVSLRKFKGGYVAWVWYSFLTECAARGLKPLPISMDFSPSKMADMTIFKKFANRDPFLRVFCLKNS